jgi:hypothetical protein
MEEHLHQAQVAQGQERPPDRKSALLATAK